jgi:hypothetical protein
MKKIVTLICILGISLTVNLNMVQAKQLKQAKKVEATTPKKLLSQNSVKGVNKKYMEGIEKIFSGVNRYNKDGQEFYSEAQDIRNDFLSEEYKDFLKYAYSIFTKNKGFIATQEFQDKWNTYYNWFKDNKSDLDDVEQTDVEKENVLLQNVFQMQTDNVNGKYSAQNIYIGKFRKYQFDYGRFYKKTYFVANYEKCNRLAKAYAKDSANGNDYPINWEK